MKLHILGNSAPLSVQSGRLRLRRAVLAATRKLGQVTRRLKRQTGRHRVRARAVGHALRLVWKRAQADSAHR